MQKLKTEKGITLIALIITIIVMLILVAVSVIVSIDGGLFSKAKEAGRKTQIAAQKESGLREEYEIDKEMGNFIGTFDEYVLKKQYDGLRIGDTVVYDPTNDGEIDLPTTSMEWQVLGVNDAGQVELISTTPTTETMEIADKDYLTAKTLLDNVCSAYGNGKGADGARSLTAEDLYELLEINPAIDEYYGDSYIYKYYGNSVKAIETSLYEDYKNDMTNSNWMDCDGQQEMRGPGWVINSENVGPFKLTNSHFWYEYDSQDDPTQNGVSLSIFGEEYWLASNWEWTDIITNISYGIYCVSGNELTYNLDTSLAMRPVVTLESDVEFTTLDAANGIYGIQ